MSILSRILVIVVVATAMVVRTPDCAYACSCAIPGTPEEELALADAVFLGRAVDVKGATQPGSGLLPVTFEPSTVWKGNIGSPLTIYTSDSSASCGVAFSPGEEYVVYARLIDGVLVTSLCDRTQTASQAVEDIKALGTGQTPQASPDILPQLPTTSAAESTNTTGSIGLLIAFGITTVAVGALVRSVTRRRRAHKSDI